MTAQLATVTPLRDTPSLMDIAGWLRRKADELEADGVLADIETLLIVHMDSYGEVGVCCFGINPPRAQVVGLLHMAAAEAMKGEAS